jgi:hypothetical protein
MAVTIFNRSATVSEILLWTNSAPASAFAAQTVGLDLTGYAAVRVLAIDHTDNGDISCDITVPLALGKGNLCGVRPALYPFYRQFTVNTAGVTFATGYVGNYGSPMASAQYAVPYRIYGVR